MDVSNMGPDITIPLNESPSEKEGKFRFFDEFIRRNKPSMKVPPKRKGNLTTAFVGSEENSVPQ